MHRSGPARNRVLVSLCRADEADGAAAVAEVESSARAGLLESPCRLPLKKHARARNTDRLSRRF